ncbi:MAG: ribonuclease [Patescibacteria group bacterium]|nr:ribonuclease [Patescibacteria group bacterium]
MKYIVGIDEVGRGPLAGPVTVGVVVCESRLYTKLKKDKHLPPRGKDSKKLTPESRQKYAQYLKSLQKRVMSKTVFDIVVVHISNKIIDEKGISWAIRHAIQKGLNKCIKKFSQVSRDLSFNKEQFQILLDGGLRAPVEFRKQKTIIKGDEKEQIIAWASILAKVSRDSLMVKAHKKFPEYAFHIHKGYGTQKHRNALVIHGLSEIHRKSFCKKLAS